MPNANLFLTTWRALRKQEDPQGHGYVECCYGIIPCGCKIVGAGTCSDPLTIEFCPTHKNAADILERLKGLCNIVLHPKATRADCQMIARECRAAIPKETPPS